MIILERYLSIYHDYDSTPDKPIWSILGNTRTEDTSEFNRFNLRVDQYVANEIKESFGYTLEEFLNLPTYIMENLLNRQRKLLAERRLIAKQQSEAAKKETSNNSYKLVGNLHNFNAF